MSAGRAHAVVIGASMSGLSTARALSGAFDRVTVLDRDELPDGVAQRGGVPQGRHLHVLLTAGADALEELFPGLLAELVADGAVTADLGLRGRYCVNGSWLARGPFGRDDVLAGRPLVEGNVRRRVSADPTVTLREGSHVTGLMTTPDRRRVVGVEVVARDGSGTTETLPADLVVDCSGRRSATPEWLSALGYGHPPVEELVVDLRYVTRHYRLPAAALDRDLVTFVGPTPDEPRGGAIALIEGDRWIVTLFGMGGEQPPLDPVGFEAYAAGLPADAVHELISHGEGLDRPVAFRYRAGVRHRYERLGEFPDGLLVAGDAVCSFNPIYGQGMTVAALEAALLRRVLDDDGAVPSPRTWFRSLAPIVDVPWDLAIGGDLDIRCIEGHRSLQTRLVNRYMARYYRAAAHDPVLAVLFGRVTSLLEPPSRLLHPATVARVVRGNRRRPVPAEGARNESSTTAA